MNTNQDQDVFDAARRIGAGYPDVASKALSGLRVGRSQACITDLLEPATRVSKLLGAFYAVLEGELSLSVPSDPRPRSLKQFQIAFVFEREYVVAGRSCDDVRRGCRMIEGVFEPTMSDRSVERALLPRTLVSQPNDASVEPLIHLLEGELVCTNHGSCLVAESIISTLLLKLMSDALASGASSGSLLQASIDEHLGPLLGLMHANSGGPWTLERMADEAGLSRSRFAERFQETLGCSPFAYLRELRMARAGTLLRTTSLTIGEIASEVGYSSESAFTAAFRKSAGLPPGQYRDTKKESGGSAAE